jgi:O-antigen/teichoic acid export membrane protein
MSAGPTRLPKVGGTDTRRVGINLVLLTGGELLAKLVTFLSFSALARALGPSRYGNLEFTLAAMVFFTLPADLGLGSYGAREIAKGRHRAFDLMAEVTAMRLFLSVLSIAGLLVFIQLIPKPAEVKLLLSLYGLSLLPSSLMLQWFFQGHDQMQWVAVASITRQSVFCFLVFAFVRPGMNIAWIGAFECASVSATAAVCFALARSRMSFRLPSLRGSYRRLIAHLRQAGPIGMTELAWAFTWYFVTVLLGLIFERNTLSFFGASHRVLMALHTFVWLYFFNLLPSISRSAATDGASLPGLMRISFTLAAWSSFFVTFVMAALSHEALALIYGRPFGEAGTCFSILVWMLPIAMLSGHYRYILIGYNLQGQLFRCTAASGLAAVALGFLLVRPFGATGGAWALVAANALNFALVYRAVQKNVLHLTFVKEIARPLLALVLAGISFLVLRHTWSVWIAAACGAAVYISVLAATAGREALGLVRRIRPAPVQVVEEFAG